MAPPDAQNIPPPAPETPPRPEAPAPAAERAEGEEQIHAGTHAALEDLRVRINEDNTQFSTSDIRPIIEKGIGDFLKSNENIGPENFQEEWRKALVTKAAETIADWDQYFDTFTLEEANKLLAEIKDPNKGVGSFEQWFQKNHPTEYQEWKAEKAEAAAQQKALGNKKKELGGKVALLEPRLAALPENIASATLAQLRDLKGKIERDDGKNLEAYEKALVDLEGKIPELEAQAKRDVDTKQSAEAAAQEAAEEADAPFLDRLNATVAGMEEGKWKTIATKLAAALTGLFVMLSKAPLIGGWVRKNFISNKLLAGLGDKNAEIAVKVEGDFRKFGLTAALANELGGKKTKDVVALIKDPQKLASLTTDTAVQQKLTHLAGELTNKGGATSEVILFEFMGNNPNWQGVAVAAAAGAAASAPPAAPAPEPAPAAAPPEAAPNLQNQLIARVNDQLKPYQGKTTDLTTSRVEFQLPFISNGRLDQVRCVISGNTFEIGMHKYRMDLPMGANLKSITIEGTAESGSAMLVAGKFGFSDNREMPLSEMLSHLEAIRQGPQTHQASIGSDTATFTKIA